MSRLRSSKSTSSFATRAKPTSSSSCQWLWLDAIACLNVKPGLNANTLLNATDCYSTSPQACVTQSSLHDSMWLDRVTLNSTCALVCLDTQEIWPLFAFFICIFCWFLCTLFCTFSSLYLHFFDSSKDQGQNEPKGGQERQAHMPGLQAEMSNPAVAPQPHCSRACQGQKSLHVLKVWEDLFKFQWLVTTWGQSMQDSVGQEGGESQERRS